MSGSIATKLEKNLLESHNGCLVAQVVMSQVDDDVVCDVDFRTRLSLDNQRLCNAEVVDENGPRRQLENVESWRVFYFL